MFLLVALSKSKFFTPVALVSLVPGTRVVKQTRDLINDTHREKRNSVQEFVKVKSWLLLIFWTCLYRINKIQFTQSIKFNQEYRSTDVSTRWFIEQTESRWLLLSTNFAAKKELFFLNTELKTVPRRGFILKPIERPYVPLKSGTGDFINSPPFKRSAVTYVTIIGDIECFQYLESETSFLEK